MIQNALRTIIIAVTATALIGCGSDRKKGFEQELIDYRKEKNKRFADASKSPLMKRDRAQFVSLNYFPADEQFNVKAKVTVIDTGKAFNMSTSTGKPALYKRTAYLDFKLKGEYFRLTAFKDPENEDAEWFVPFTDETCGDETYGGGRYLDVNPEKDSVTVDFNKAYNPYCHYNPDYTCPVPPLENDLDVQITAGEKIFKEL